jgi:hypothetical protein
MTAFAQVPGLVTDGAFYPDGRHVLLRTYGTASVYTYPGFDLVGTVRLPRQNQGEGIAVGADGRVLVSTEGVAADVLQVTVPAAPAGGPEPSRRPPVPAAVPPDPEPRDAADWTVIALVAAGLGGLVVLTVRASRIRAPLSVRAARPRGRCRR